MTLNFWIIGFWKWPGAEDRSRSRKIFEGWEPDLARPKKNLDIFMDREKYKIVYK